MFNNLFLKGRFDIETLQMLYDQTMNIKTRLENERTFIDTSTIFKGLEYYRFLMECLPPASVPDVPFMSALLELVT